MNSRIRRVANTESWTGGLQRGFSILVSMLMISTAHANIAGFSSGAGWTATASSGAAPALGASSATLTNTGVQNRAGTVFCNTRHDVGLGFTAQFIYQQTATANASAPGDGAAFVLQNSGSGAAALGWEGGSIGYGGISNSFAIVLDMNQGAPRKNVLGSGSAGSYNDNTASACAPVAFDSGHQIRVNITYTSSNRTMAVSLTDLTTTATFSHNFTSVNLNSLLGGNGAWVGFTGATGQNTNTQVISGFTLTAAVSSQPLNWNVANGNWPTAGNWSPNLVPTSANPVNIVNGGSCTLATSTAGDASVVNVRGSSTLHVLGTLTAGDQIRVGDMGTAGTLYLRDGGVINSPNVIVGANGSSAGTLHIGDGGAPGIMNAPISSAGYGVLHFDHNSPSYSCGQPITGQLDVIHAAGTTTLSSAGTNYTGTTTINGGTLRIANDVGFNSPIFLAGGALLLDIGADVRLLQGIIGNGAITVAGNQRTARLAGVDSGFSGTFTLPSDTRGMMWSSAFAGSGGAYWDLNGQFALVETPGAATVELGALAGANGGTQIAAFGGAGLKVFEIGRLNADSSFAGQIKDISSFGGGGTGTIGVRKVGVGALTLSNTNTYTGGTSVDDGTLIVNGAVSNTSVGAFGTVGGTGTLNGPTTIAAGGTLSPGAGVGQITVSGVLTLNGVLKIDITGATPGSGYDVVLNSGNGGSIGADATLAFGTLSGSFSPSDKLFIVNKTGSGSLSGAFVGLPDGGAAGTIVSGLSGFGGLEWRIYYGADQTTGLLAGGNDIALAAAAPPSPDADMNCDHVVNNFDIDAFVLALLDAPAYAALYPGCDRANGDVNHDNALNNFDIDPFVTCVLQAGCP